MQNWKTVESRLILNQHEKYEILKRNSNFNNQYNILCKFQCINYFGLC